MNPRPFAIFRNPPAFALATLGRFHRWAKTGNSRKFGRGISPGHGAGRE